jgi:phosphoserine phosphatase
MKITVFDFDRTLTNYDTMTAFLLFCIKKKPIKWLLFPFYISLKIVAKFGIISIKREKEISLFILAPNEINKFKEYCLMFTQTIKFNQIKDCFDNEINSGNRVIVLSASPEIYLKMLFPNIEVIGTTFSVKNNKIVSIDRHPYGKEKLIALIEIGINQFESFYYDSKSDEVLLPICKKPFLIKEGRIIK